MANFNDFDVEVQNIKDTTPESFSGSVSTAGSPVTITPTSSKSIQYAFIEANSTRDPNNSNSINDALLYSIDGGSNYHTWMSGESISIQGLFDNLKLDTNNNGTYYQVILWS